MGKIFRPTCASMPAFVQRMLSHLGVLAILGIFPCQFVFADTAVSLFSGNLNGEFPLPIFLKTVRRGDRFLIEFQRGVAQVNYLDQDIILERVVQLENGAKVSCPWFQKLDGVSMGVRVNQQHQATIDERVECSDGTCTGIGGKPIPRTELLFGRYKLPKCKLSTGADFGFVDLHLLDGKMEKICCPEFTVERVYSRVHYFDRLLDSTIEHEQAITDLDVDFNKIYLTFQNKKGDRANCKVADLFKGGNDILIDSLRDCVLPDGNEFVMYAESRFFIKDTRACGKFVTRGQKQSDGTYQPDWFMGWYECDGKVNRSPILKQFTYPTRIDLTLVDLNIQGGGKLK